MTTDQIITIASCIIGSGGVTALITSFLNRDLKKAQIFKIHTEAQKSLYDSLSQERAYYQSRLKEYKEASANEVVKLNELLEEKSNLLEKLDKLEKERLNEKGTN